MAITLSEVINTTDYTKAPFNSGVMTMTPEDEVVIREELFKYIDEFVPSMDYGYPDNQYLAITFKNTNVGYYINGDTIDYLFNTPSATVEGEV